MNRAIIKTLLALLFVALPCRGNNNCPDEKAIASLGEKSKQTYQNFLSESLYQRLSFQYNDGQLSDQNKTILTEAAKKYTKTIKQILAEQLEYKKQVEDYTGNDWEEKFGETGLWNQLKADVLNSQVRLSQIESFRTFQNQPQQNASADDFETNARIAFVQLKAGADEHLKKTIEKWPQSRELFGKLVLEKLGFFCDYSKITPTEAALAAEAAIKNNSEKYADILSKLTNTAQLPVVFYAAGLAIEKDKPLQAMELFIEAGKDKKTIFADDADRKAANLAYSLYNQKVIDCEKTIAVLKNHLAQTADDYDALYCYAFVLKNCQRKDDSLKILEQVINSNDELALIAEYDAVMLKLDMENDYQQTSQRLDNLLQKTKLGKDNELHNRILETYCKILLNLGGTENAQKIVDLPTEKNVLTLKARAYWVLGKKAEAINHMLKAENLTKEDANFCTIILKDIGSNLDELAEAADKNFLENCINLSGKLSQQYNLLDAEILTLEFQIVQIDSNCPETLKTQIEKIREKTSLKNHDFLRLYARFHTKTGDFEKACNLWSELASATNSKNTDFWPAKYYQLLCLSKISEKDRQKAFHAAEVLLSSRRDIPQFWQKKLLNLITQ